MTTCIECGKAIKHGSRCEECSYQYRLRLDKIRYNERKAQGICVKCGINKAMTGKTRCAACNDSTLAYERARSRQRPRTNKAEYNEKAKEIQLREVFECFGIKDGERIGVLLEKRK